MQRSAARNCGGAMNKEFRVKLEHTGEKGTTTFLRAPFDPAREFGSKRVPVCGTINGIPYRSTLAKMPKGGMYAIPVCKELREQIGAEVGDTVAGVIERDTQERTVEPPPELAAALKTNKAAREGWNNLCYTSRKEYAASIAEAKKEETRRNRLEKVLSILAQAARK